MNRWRVRQFWVITLLTPLLVVLQSDKMFAQEDNAKNLNTPFFGQDPAALGQQYIQQQAEEQKKMDAMLSKTKSKDKGRGEPMAQPNPHSSPALDALPPSYLGQPISPGASGFSPPSDPAKSSQPAPNGELNRGY